MQSVSTFLLRNGNDAAKTILKEMSFSPTVVIPYSEEEMRLFFGACSEEEELLFKYSLQSDVKNLKHFLVEARPALSGESREHTGGSGLLSDMTMALIS
jgi:hypothetical protein